VVGPHLVRLSDEAGWRAECLAIPASVARDPKHVHAIMPWTLRDAWVVLWCATRGSEW
jgi:hypothetical protein